MRFEEEEVEAGVDSLRDFRLVVVVLGESGWRVEVEGRGESGVGVGEGAGELREKFLREIPESWRLSSAWRSAGQPAHCELERETHDVAGHHKNDEKAENEERTTEKRQIHFLALTQKWQVSPHATLRPADLRIACSL